MTIQQQCTRCGFQTQTSACENCGSAALDVIGPAPPGPPEAAPVGGVDLLNAPVRQARFDTAAQPLRENPAVP
jgi:hypothetical protein